MTSCCPAAARTSSLLKTDIHDWNITFVDTGSRRLIGERLARGAASAPRR